MRPRVVLVEDDASVRRFVELALEDLDIELIACESVAAAVQALRQAPARLLLTDLMLPEESGLDLLQRLVDEPGLRGSARVAVFSAGLDPAVREQLKRFDVWRVLHKPVPLATLNGCVLEALAGTERAAEAQPPSVTEDGGEARAIALHFGGDQALFHAFKSGCLQQFAMDLQAGDLACRSGDAAHLQRISHSLKSVLQMLGHAQASALARAVEEAAGAGRMDEAAPGWERLAAEVGVLISSAD